jgi:hypothetical protein
MKAVDCALAVNKTKRETNEENPGFTIMKIISSIILKFISINSLRRHNVMQNSTSGPISSNIHDKNTFLSC